MKKMTGIFLAIITVALLSACNAENLINSAYTGKTNTTTGFNFNNHTKSSGQQKDKIITTEADTPEVLIELAEKDVANTIALLNADCENLITEIDSFEKYKNNASRVEEFYDNVISVQKQLNIRLREYSYQYAEMVISSDKSHGDKYEDLDDIYDTIYDDLGDEIYDEIYEGIFDDMYDAFYDGVIDDGYDTVPYKEWSNIHSDEYGLWSDAHTDCYRDWSDMRSDVYGFWSDMRSEMWSDDMDRAKEKMEDFLDDIAKLIAKAS